MDFSLSGLNCNSVEPIPGYQARAAFSVTSSSVFKEEVDILPIIVDEGLSYVPWGGDNRMPFNIIDLIERDETLATCQLFNAEVWFPPIRSELLRGRFGLPCDCSAVSLRPMPRTRSKRYFTPIGTNVSRYEPTLRKVNF